MIVKFMAFAFVGAFGTAVHYSILYALVEFYKLSPVAASGYGALAGLLVNYGLNYSLTFKSQQSHRHTFPKFAFIASLGLGINLLLMAWLTPHLYYLYAQVVTTGIVLIWNFLANSLWTFQLDIAANPAHHKSTFMIQKFFTAFSVLLLILTIRIMTLGFYPLYDPSESRYAEMARKMLETGNWVTPWFDYGVPFWGKPPLTIWLTASSLWLGGINDFFARLPSFLVSLATLGIVFHLMSVQRGRDKAWNAVIMLASSVLFFVMSGTVAMDVCMSFAVTLTCASFWLALRGEKAYWSYLFFIGLSIGLLAKGPITIVLAGVGIGLWTLLSNEWLRVWQRLPWIKGTLLMLAISVPWYLVAEQHTPGFLEYFFIGEHWKRFTESGWTGDLYGNGRAHVRGTIWVYWLAAAFPWSLLFLKIATTAVVKKQSSELLQSNDGWRLYCLLWMLSPLLFFTMSANIIWTYVLPGLPGFALLLSDWIECPKYRAALALCVPLSFLSMVIVYQFPNVDFYRSQQHLVRAYQHAAQPNERLLYFMERPDSAQFYLHGKAIKMTNNQMLQESLTPENHDFYVLPKEVLASFPKQLQMRFEPIQSRGTFTLFHAGQVESK